MIACTIQRNAIEINKAYLYIKEMWKIDPVMFFGSWSCIILHLRQDRVGSPHYAAVIALSERSFS